MAAGWLAPRFLILYGFVLSGLFVHFRGKVRHRLLRQLTDHSTLMAPYNTFIYFFSAVPSSPILKVSDFPELALLRENWQVIRDEAYELFERGYLRKAPKYNDLAFNSFFRSGWKRFYFKWYDDFLPSARALCPRTVALLERIPSINAAMFTLLAPRSHLVRHRDPFAGSLRYHLGLITPNSEKCRILIDGIPYHWRDAQDILFDATYIHRATNETDEVRIILFCDVDRPLRGWFARGINHFVTRYLARATSTQNVPGEKVGFLNRGFEYAYQIRLLGKRLKAANRPVYYLVKFSLLGGLLYGLLVWL
ncbi:MAG: aspartyl/asparaginyl beta-hydroxylase domain-containing protein [Acidobacteriota bacterium]